MLGNSKAFSGFSVDDIAKAATFYREMLGIAVEETPMGLTLKFDGGTNVFVYPKPDHQAAAFTILNFPVSDIDETVDALTAADVVFERYEEGMPAPQDEKGILRNDDPAQGPVGIAWFKDPAGNILSVLQQ